MPRLVVFDCDGTLVDSERIGVQVGRRMLAGLGVALSEREFVERFVGCSAQHWADEIARTVGGTPPADWSQRHDELFATTLAEQLEPVPGAVDVLDALDRLGLSYRLASNSDRSHIARALELVGLADRFRDRVHSAHEVARGKPEPDVYLTAAAAGSRSGALLGGGGQPVRGGGRAGGRNANVCIHWRPASADAAGSHRRPPAGRPASASAVAGQGPARKRSAST
jgi:beta-phosphoglucomutase-like phosphatase (HAD superfamily)